MQGIKRNSFKSQVAEFAITVDNCDIDQEHMAMESFYRQRIKPMAHLWYPIGELVG